MTGREAATPDEATAAGSVDVREMLRAEPDPPLVPGRFRAALATVCLDVMPAKWVVEAGRQLVAHRRALRSVSTYVDGAHEVQAWDALSSETAALARAFREEVFARFDDARESCAVPAFDVRSVALGARLVHHGGGDTRWRADLDHESDTRRIGFELTLTAEPRMFAGGGVEFLDGTVHPPTHNALLFRHPFQTYRVQPVECWSANAAHGRWSLFGWVLGKPSADWVDLLHALREHQHKPEEHPADAGGEGEQ